MTISCTQNIHAGRDGSAITTMPRALLSATVLSVAIGSAVGVQAQEGKMVGLEEIVVTASRREEGMQSIAASIAAVTANDLEAKGITEFADVTKSVSGIYLVQNTNMTNSSLRIRGVGTRGESSTDPSVGVVVDGVYQLRQGAVFTELLDLERIEVLRGPQGTNFGKNTTSGVIAIHTANPDTEELSGRVQGVLGNLDNQEVRGVLNVPLIDGTLAARVSGYTAQRDGYTENVFLDEDTRNVDREGGRIKLLWNASDAVTVKLSAEHLDQQSRLDQGLVEYGSLALGSAGTRTYSQWYAILPAAPTTTPPPVSLGKTQQNNPDRSEDTVERYVLNIEWDLPSHTLTSISAVEDIETYLSQDRDRTTLPALVLTTNPLTDILTQEIQLASNIDGPLSYIVGGFYQEEELVSDTKINGNTVSFTERDQSSQALFGNATYQLNDQLSTVVGLRWTEDDKQGTAADAGNLMLEETFSELTYTAKLLYQLDADKLLYFSHDKGFKSGGVNRIVPNRDESLRVWEPEVSYNYELGIKSEWLDNRLRVNAAAFYQTFEDYQVTTSLSLNNVTHVLITNAAEVISQGVEADFAAAVTDYLTVDGSVALIATEYDSYQNAPCPTPTWQGCVAGIQDLSGEQLDNAPKLTFNLGAEYRRGLEVANNLEWFARIDAAYRGETELEAMLTDADQDAYTLYNARVGFEAPGEWKVSFWGNNITDEEYAISGLREEFGLQLFQGLTRTYGVTADWYF